jgi:TonB family protein
VLVNEVEGEYPASERAAGHQGEIVLRGVVTPEGTITEATVQVSSRAPGLDEAALAAFRHWTFKPGLDAAGKPIAMPVRAKVEYAKDSVSTLPRKTCADFVADVRWHDETFPERKRSEMYLYRLTLGALIMVSLPRSNDFKAALTAGPSASDFQKAFDATFEHCSAHPNGNRCAAPTFLG